MRLRRAAIALLLGLSSCKKVAPVTADECERLLAKYGEMLAKRDRPELSAIAVDTLIAAEEARARESRSFRACPHELSREQMDCALSAWDPDAIERCLVPMP